MEPTDDANVSPLTAAAPNHMVRGALSDAVVNEPSLKLVDRFLQRLRIAKARRFIRKGDRVLDIGCADGALFKQLHERIGSGVGFDHALAHSVGDERFQLIAGPLTSDFGQPGEFDVVSMLAVVEHLQEDEIPALRDQCVRLLKPGGQLIITVPSRQVDTILSWLSRLHLISGMSLHEHHGFDPADVPCLFGGTGLELVRTRRFQFGMNNLFVFRNSQVLQCTSRLPPPSTE